MDNRRDPPDKHNFLGRLDTLYKETRAKIADALWELHAQSTNFAAEQERCEKITPSIIKATASEERITLDVGGTQFATQISTLTRLPDTFFSAMFGGRFPLKPQADGTYFIDRDPFMFKHILNFIRDSHDTDSLLYLSDSELHQLLRDANYYLIADLEQIITNIQTERAARVDPMPKISWLPNHLFNLSEDNTTATRNDVQADFYEMPVITAGLLPRNKNSITLRFTIRLDSRPDAWNIGLITIDPQFPAHRYTTLCVDVNAVKQQIHPLSADDTDDTELYVDIIISYATPHVSKSMSGAWGRVDLGTEYVREISMGHEIYPYARPTTNLPRYLTLLNGIHISIIE